MAYVIYNSKQAAIDREAQLTADGIAAGYFPDGERYDICQSLVVNHPVEDKAAIEIYVFKGLVLPLSLDDLMPQNYSPLFTADELAGAVYVLTDDWYTTNI